MNPLLAYLRRVWGYAAPDSPVPVVALTAAAMLVVQLAARTIHDVDIFWQLRFGDLILRDGIPATEPFLAGRQAEPHVPVAWLAQAAYAGLRQIGGWPLLRMIDAVLWFAGFGVVAAVLARRAGNRWPVAAGLWVGWIAAVPFASLRPQSFGACAFGLLVVLARSNLPVRTTLLVSGPLLLLWQNLHPSVVTGGVYLAAAAVGEGIVWLRSRGPFPWRLIGLGVLAGVATVATPGGFELLRVSAYNAEISRTLGVNEWQPLTQSWYSFGRGQGWWAVAVTLVMMAVRCRHLRLADVLPVLAFTALTLTAQRFILFWGIAVIPVWTAAFTRLDGPPIRVRWLPPAVLLVLAAVVPVIVLPAPFMDGFPFRGLPALRDVRGPVYTCYLWGGVVTDDGYPDRHPTHDGRYYLFRLEEWDAYAAAADGAVPVDEVVAKFRPAAFFLRPGSDDGLIANLRRHPGWAEAFADGSVVVFVRRGTR